MTFPKIAFFALSLIVAWGCSPEADRFLDSVPSGAGVWDGETLVGNTPYRLPEGNATFAYTLRYPGCEELFVTHAKDAEEDFTLAEDGTRHMSVNLKQIPAADCTLWCLSQPEGAEVIVEGESKGVTPLQLKGLSQRSLELSFQMKDRETVVKTVEWGVTQTDQVVTVQLPSKLVEFYRNKIKSEPLDLFHYTDLGHQLILEGQLDEAMEVFGTGLRLHFSHKSSANVYRLWSEVDRVIVVQYVYGDQQVIALARKKTLELLRKLKDEYPDINDLSFYTNYVNCADVLKYRQEAQEMFARAWKKWPKHKTLMPYLKKGFTEQ